MLTREEILTEYGKCLMDPIYAIETYLHTFDKTQEGIVPFKLFPRQKEIITAYTKHRFNLVTKPRQAGVSTTTAAFMCMKVAFADENNPEAVLIIANKQDLALEFLAKIKDFLSQMPRWIWGSEYYGTEEKEEKSIFLKDSTKEIRLPNGSRVKAVATSKDALRGFTPTYLIMDEAAYIENGAKVFGAALTSLGTGGKATLISTPNGMDALYYKTYEQSKSGDNNFNIIEMKWYEDLRYNKDLTWIKKTESGEDEEVPEIEFTYASYEKMLMDGYKPTSSWYREMAKGMNNDLKMIAQELDVSFIGSGGNVINEKDIEYQEKHNVREPIRTEGLEKETWIWAEPQDGHQYIMGVDVSRGDGEDYSTIVIVDVTEMEEVLEYRGKMPPDLLAELVEEYGNRYGAYTVVDITGGSGVPTVLKLLEFNYKRLHYDSVNGKVFSEQTKKIRAKAKENKVPGFTMTSIRTPMISNLEIQIRLDAIKVRSRRMTSEMKTFVFVNGRADHKEGYHDDLLIAMAMLLWVLEHSFKKLEKLSVQAKAMLGSWGVNSGTMPQAQANLVAPRSVNTNASVLLVSPTQLSGGTQDKPKPNFSPVVAKNMQDPRGQYLWLFSNTK